MRSDLYLRCTFKYMGFSLIQNTGCLHTGKLLEIYLLFILSTGSLRLSKSTGNILDFFLRLLRLNFFLYQLKDKLFAQINLGKMSNNCFINQWEIQFVVQTQSTIGCFHLCIYCGIYKYFRRVIIYYRAVSCIQTGISIKQLKDKFIDGKDENALLQFIC